MIGALGNKTAIGLGAAALFAFLVIYEVHFVTVVNDMSEMNKRMRTLSSSLESVRGIDKMSAELEKLGPELTTVNRQLRAVRRNTQAVTALPRLEQRLAPVAGQMAELKAEIGQMRTAIGPLDPMARDLRGMRTAIGPLDPMAGDLRTMRGAIAQLVADIQAMEAQMDRVQRHVANIDRKTGPTPPDAVPAGGR